MGIGTHFDHMPHCPEIAGPADGCGKSYGRNPTESGSQLFLDIKLFFFVNLVDLCKFPLQFFQMFNGADKNFHTLFVFTNVHRHISGEVVQTHKAQRFLRDGDTGAVPYQFMGHYTAHISENKIKRCMLKNAAVADLQYVGQIGLIAFAHPGHIWIETGAEGTVAESAHHLAQEFRVTGRITFPFWSPHML